jgi:hypothetical protein
VKTKVLFYLYGTPHIIGSLGGLLGLSLFFGGVINSYWYLIVAGLYAAGVIGWPRSPEYHLQLDREAGGDEIRSALERLVKSLRGQVARPIADQVQRIVDMIQEALPRLTRLERADHAAYTIRETALSYLPETLENYLRLPKAYRRFHHLDDGRTPQALLQEQLEILESQMNEVLADLHRDDLDGLQAHGRFLRDRFARSDRFLS